jgi:predicted ABC-type ATPase
MAVYPLLLFVAGPSGAPKSTFSKKIVETGAVILDVDQVIPRIEVQSPDMPKKQVYQVATQQSFNQAIEAMRQKQHFTLETNFRDEQLVDIAAKFKQHGCTSNLVCLTLRNTKESVSRVIQRVKNGGHYVGHNNIEQNYDLGLQYLEHFADRFYNLEILVHPVTFFSCDHC